MVVTTDGLLHQELKLNENFKEQSTSFLSFQLLPEVSQCLSVPHAWPQASSACIVISVAAGAALGSACRLRGHLRLEPAGPGPAPDEDSPSGLLRSQLPDQGEEAGTARRPASPHSVPVWLGSSAGPAHQRPCPGWQPCLGGTWVWGCVTPPRTWVKLSTPTRGPLSQAE